MKVVRLSALRTGRLYPPGNIPSTHFCQGLSQPQGHSAAGRIMPMKNSNDTIGNRTRDHPACSAVPQPTMPPYALCTAGRTSLYERSIPRKGATHNKHKRKIYGSPAKFEPTIPAIKRLQPIPQTTLATRFKHYKLVQLNKK